VGSESHPLFACFLKPDSVVLVSRDGPNHAGLQNKSVMAGPGKAQGC